MLDRIPAHADFHWALLDVELGSLERSILSRISGMAQRYIILGYTAFGDQDLHNAAMDHEALFEGFARGDGPAVRQQLEQHLHSVEHALLEHFTP